MNSEHDADLFGEELDYEQIWRDRYHQSCEQYEELLAISEGWVKKLSSDNDELQRQLREAPAVFAALRSKVPSQEPEETPLQEDRTSHAAESRASRDDHPAAAEKKSGETIPPSTTLRKPATSQATNPPFGMKSSSRDWWRHSASEKRKRSDETTPDEQPPLKKPLFFSSTSAPTTPPASKKPTFGPANFFSKPASQRREEASRAAERERLAQEEREQSRRARARRSANQRPPRPATSPPFGNASSEHSEEEAWAHFAHSVTIWHATAMLLFRNKSTMTMFPTPPHFQCVREACKANKLVMGLVCECDIERAFEVLVEQREGAVGKVEFLKRQRAEFHPDRFAGVGKGNGEKERVQKCAKEVFVVVERLYKEAVGRAGGLV
ncbi:hypothetical protein Slin15195_G040030 [Septoria linicola]|uniref:Uncharacterized protein n=1 Tax=Septoria linicola TaxID=215465 RepID=A0A9Q9EI38_9PEZI|nr:hypothetical protein Slin15195_G040030 [Septoria linicola]